MNIDDIMTISMARLLRDGDKVFHGVASPMPMTAIMAAKRLHAPNLVYLNIAGGVNALPKNLTWSTDSPALLDGTSSLFSLSEIFDLSMRGGLDVAFLGGVQFDEQGCVNNSVIGSYTKPKVKLPGGAGSAVLVPTAKRPIFWRTKHDKITFVHRCDFVTTSCQSFHVVTPLCVLEFKSGRYYVKEIHPNVSEKEIIENTAFDLDFSTAVQSATISKEEMSVMNFVDPKRIRNIEFLKNN